MPIRPVKKVAGDAPADNSNIVDNESSEAARQAVTPERVLQVRSRQRVAVPDQPAEVTVSTPSLHEVPATVNNAKSRKAKKEKKQPTGDYPKGYCRPPVETRFDGTKPGPGRPRGAVSQDTLLKKHLTQVRPVAIEGKQTKLQVRELVLMLRVKEALSGNRRSADYVLAEAARLFSERVATAEHGSPLAWRDIDEHDRAILEAFQAALLAGARGSEEEGDDPANDDEEGDNPDDLEPVS